MNVIAIIIIYYSYYKYYINIIVTHITVTDVKLDEMVADCIKDTNSDESSEGDDVYDPALLVCYIMFSNIMLLLE